MATSNSGTEVFLASPRGFCAGVVRAIHTVQEAIKKYPAPVYVKHQIVHNPTVVEELATAGAITVEDVTDVPEGATVVFSAHGSPPSDYEIAKSRKLNVIDATCPLVTKVHIEARKYEREGRRIVLIGHDGHQEVRGSRGYADVFLVDDRDPEAPLPDWDSDEKVTVLTQTTLSVDDTAKTIERLRNKFKDIIVRGDICYATTNRQRAVKDIAKQMDVFIIIGSDQSSNCIRLKEVAEACGVKSYRINHPDELQQDWFKPGDKIGIASSASTPEKTVSDVVSAIKPTNIHQTGAASENIAFKLPSGVQ